MKFNAMIARRGMKVWARRHEWPFRIVWKKQSLRDLTPRRRRLRHRMREWRKAEHA